jgi:hypothetical protein
MPTRRAVLSTIATGLGALALKPLQAAGLGQETTSPLSGPIGLQLWSLRAQLPKDLPGTLAKVRAMGFREVEAAGLYKHTLAEFRAALDQAGLRCQSAHAGFGELRDAAAGAFEQTKGFGATWVVCPWIDHKDDTFTREDSLKAAEVFNRVGKAAEDAGLKFAYHCHGYEFVPSTEALSSTPWLARRIPRASPSRSTCCTRTRGCGPGRAHHEIRAAREVAAPQGPGEGFRREGGHRDRAGVERRAVGPVRST